jgi:hypothetical protein
LEFLLAIDGAWNFSPRIVAKAAISCHVNLICTFPAVRRPGFYNARELR